LVCTALRRLPHHRCVLARDSRGVGLVGNVDNGSAEPLHLADQGQGVRACRPGPGCHLAIAQPIEHNAHARAGPLALDLLMGWLCPSTRCFNTHLLPVSQTVRDGHDRAGTPSDLPIQA
jgi:hypothetical protein